MAVLPVYDLSDLSGIRVYGEELLIPATEGYDWRTGDDWGYWRQTSRGKGIASNDPFTGLLRAQIQRGDTLILNLHMPGNEAKFWQATASQLETDERAFITWTLAHRVPADVAAQWANELK